MSPTPGPDCLGLISNSDKTGSGQEHDLSYRIMVDAGLTPAGLDYCRSRVPSPYCFRSGSGILAMRLVAREQIRGSPATGLLIVQICERLPAVIADDEARAVKRSKTRASPTANARSYQRGNGSPRSVY